jgi:DNA repair exonuclease SbcCD nuclease subunit
MKTLRMGDPHVKITNLEESEKLMQFVLETARLHNVDTIELLGDLFDTMSIIRLEVLEFWRVWLWKLSQEFITIVLVGNHDQSGNRNSPQHSLSSFVMLNPDRLWIIERAALIVGIGYLPYIHDNDTFVKEANTLAELGAKFLVSHTEYAGSQFDNGMYAPHGVNPDLIDTRLEKLLSGHVHTEQEFGRVIYPGTARWASVSDANKRKGIWIYEHDLTGSMIGREFLSTGGVVEPIVAIAWKEGEPTPQLADGARISVEMIGTSAWIAQNKDLLKGKASIKTKITDSKKTETRKASLNLEDYLRNTLVSTMDREALVALAKEMGLV